MSIEAMRLALEYLESEVPFYECEGNYPPTGMTESIEALRAAIEAAEKQSVCARCGGIVYDPVILQQAEKQEPVAWADKYDIEREGHDFYVNRQQPAKDGEPLYTAPPQREWVGLNDEEVMREFWNFYPEEYALFTDVERAFYRAIEAKLKEKNNG